MGTTRGKLLIEFGVCRRSSEELRASLGLQGDASPEARAAEAERQGRLQREYEVGIPHAIHSLSQGCDWQHADHSCPTRKHQSVAVAVRPVDVHGAVRADLDGCCVLAAWQARLAVGAGGPGTPHTHPPLRNRPFTPGSQPQARGASGRNGRAERGACAGPAPKWGAEQLPPALRSKDAGIDLRHVIDDHSDQAVR